MTVRRGETDPALLREAQLRLLEARDIDGLEAILDSVPMFASPAFHRPLVEHMERGIPDAYRYAYDGLFYLLHRRLHRTWARVRATAAMVTIPDAPEFTPPYYLEIGQLLADRLPLPPPV